MTDCSSVTKRNQCVFGASIREHLKVVIVELLEECSGYVDLALNSSAALQPDFIMSFQSPYCRREMI